MNKSVDWKEDLISGPFSNLETQPSQWKERKTSMRLRDTQGKRSFTDLSEPGEAPTRTSSRLREKKSGSLTCSKPIQKCSRSSGDTKNHLRPVDPVLKAKMLRHVEHAASELHSNNAFLPDVTPEQISEDHNLLFWRSVRKVSEALQSFIPSLAALDIDTAPNAPLDSILGDEQILPSEELDDIAFSQGPNEIMSVPSQHSLNTPERSFFESPLNNAGNRQEDELLRGYPNRTFEQAIQTPPSIFSHNAKTEVLDSALACPPWQRSGSGVSWDSYYYSASPTSPSPLKEHSKLASALKGEPLSCPMTFCPVSCGAASPESRGPSTPERNGQQRQNPFIQALELDASTSRNLKSHHSSYGDSNPNSSHDLDMSTLQFSDDVAGSDSGIFGPFGNQSFYDERAELHFANDALQALPPSHIEENWLQVNPRY